jgi:hypothetical protein
MWLHCRSRLKKLYPWFIFALGGVYWIWGSLRFGSIFYNEAANFIATAYFSSLILKFWIGAESSQRLTDDRRNGSLELLFSTPLRVKDVLSGHWKAILDQFVGPLIFLCVLTLFFAFLLLVRFKSTLDEQRDKEQLHIDTQKAVGHGTRLQGRREEEERKSALGADRPSSRWSSAARSSRRSAAAAGAPMDVTAVVTALKRNSPAARSTAGTEPAKETRQGVTAVYAETADVLKDLEGMCTTSADRTRDLH